MFNYLTKLGVVFTLALTVTASISKPVEINRKVVCDDAEAIFKYILEEYSEIPVWRGVNGDGDVSVIMANSETTTWTYIIIDRRKRACIVDGGEGFEFRLPKNS